jgi:sugar/nucleoside kinase (ribokinase family)
VERPGARLRAAAVGVGGGDAFAGGLIYGLLNLTSRRDALEFAVAAEAEDSSPARNGTRRPYLPISY